MHCRNGNFSGFALCMFFQEQSREQCANYDGWGDVTEIHGTNKRIGISGFVKISN